jgi:hypothetical protein
MNTPIEKTSTPQRFEPNVQFAWGQTIVLAALSAVAIAIIDCFKFPQDRSLRRFGCVCAGIFVAGLVFFWFRSARTGCQTVIVDDNSLTVETKTKRDVLPWQELSEVTIVGDSVLKLKSRNARFPFKLENHGFTKAQWDAIKNIFKSRGYELKIGLSAI